MSVDIIQKWVSIKNIADLENTIRDLPDINEIGSKRPYAMLYLAVMDNKFEYAKIILQNGGDPNQILFLPIVFTLEPGEDNALFRSCYNGNFELFELLINYGGNTHKILENRDILESACEGGNYQIYKYLLDNGHNVNPNLLNSYLYAAAAKGEMDLINNLIDRGADIYYKYTTKSNLTEATIDRAFEHGNEKFVIYLLNEDIETKRLDDLIYKTLDSLYLDDEDGAVKQMNILKALDKKDYDFNVLYEERSKSTLLHIASKLPYSQEIIKFLLEKGLDINAIDYDGNTALHIAFKKNRNPWIVKLLIDSGADKSIKNKKGRMPDEEGYSLIHKFYEADRFDNIEKLIEFGYSIDELEYKSMDSTTTILFEAVKNRKLADVIKIAKLGANPYLESKDDGRYKTPIFKSIENGETDITSFLEQHVSNANSNNATNNESATVNYIDVAEQLKSLKELLDLDIITQQEFDSKKKELLNL